MLYKLAVGDKGLACDLMIFLDKVKSKHISQLTGGNFNFDAQHKFGDDCASVELGGLL